MIGNFESLNFKNHCTMLIKKFTHIGISDIASVGGKNASLGEMLQSIDF